MAIIEPESRDEDYDRRINALTAPKAQASTGTIIGNTFQRDNLVARGINQFNQPTFEPLDGYDPLPDLTPAELTYTDQFEDVKSPQELQFKRAQIKRHQDAQQLFAQASPGVQIAATLLANVADVDLFVPLGIVSKLNKAGRIAGGAALLGGAEFAKQRILQDGQPDRSDNDVLIDTLIAGAIGGFAGVFTNAVFTGTVSAKALDDTIIEQANLVKATPSGGSAGAARVDDVRPEDTIITNPIVRAINAFQTRTPFLRGVVSQPGPALLGSAIAASRKLSLQFVDSAVTVGNRLDGPVVGASLDNRVKQYDVYRAGYIQLVDVHRKDSKLSRVEFNKRAAIALRNGDIDSDNPAISAFAKAVREQIIVPVSKRAIDARVLPEDILSLKPRGAESYLTRLYNKKAIQANQEGFKALVVNHLRRGDDGSLTDDELRDAADDIMGKILGTSDDVNPVVTIAARRGPLKERTFNITDNEIQDFLVNDIGDVLAYFIRSTAPQIELARTFGEGTRLQDLVKLINDDATALVKANPGRSKAISDNAARDVQNLTALHARLTNTVGAHFNGYGGLHSAERALVNVRKVAGVQLLGSMTLGSLTDLARPMMSEGYMRTFGLLARGLTDGFKEVKMGREQAQAFGVALERALSRRANAFTQPTDVTNVSRTAFEQNLDLAQDAFYNSTGINFWNEKLKGFGGTLASTRILETVQQVADGSISNVNMKKLRRARIDARMANRIAAQSKHFHREGGTILASIDKWDDVEAANAFRNAVISDVDNIIVTPGPGDLPLWFDRPVINMAGQLKSHMFGAHQRVLLGAIDRADQNVLVGVAGLISLGMALTYAKDIARGKDPNKRKLESYVVEGVDRSGLLGIFIEGDNLLSKFAGTQSAASQLAGQPTRRFLRADRLDALSPASSVATKLGKDMTKLLDGDESSSVVKLTPLNNHIIWLGALTAADQAGIVDREDIEGSKKK